MLYVPKVEPKLLNRRMVRERGKAKFELGNVRFRADEVAIFLIVCVGYFYVVFTFLSELR